MRWFGWLLVGLLVFEALARIGMIGRRRKPLEPIDGIVGLVVNGLWVWAILVLGGVL